MLRKATTEDKKWRALTSSMLEAGKPQGIVAIRKCKEVERNMGFVCMPPKRIKFLVTPKDFYNDITF